MNWIVALAYLTKETRFIQQFAFYACIRRTRLMDDSDASFLNVSQDISNLYIDWRVICMEDRKCHESAMRLGFGDFMGIIPFL